MEQSTMPLQLTNANVVIVAHHFNPTITDQLWLSQHGIVKQDEAAGPYMFTDMLVQVQTKDFHLLIVPDRCQFTPSSELENQQEVINNRLGQLIQLLPHTPYRAIGLNFNWQFLCDNDGIARFTRARFFVDDSPLHRSFDAADSRFGGYLSKPFHSGRLKLDVKPALIITNHAKSEAMHFAFNFNLDLPDEGDKVRPLLDFLNRWSEASDVARQTARTSIEGYDR